MIEKILAINNLKFLIIGAGISLSLAIGAMIIGLLLGVLGATAKISKSKFLNTIAFMYVEVIRGTPMLLQILFLYLGFPNLYTYITGGYISPNPFLIGLIAMGINSGAYTTELIRSGIQSIGKGQWEAGRSLGLSYPMTMRYIILPQAFKNILPPLVSEFIILTKDSSLVSVIGATELLRRSRILGSQYFNYLIPLFTASLMYLVMTMTISYFARKLERRLMTND